NEDKSTATKHKKEDNAKEVEVTKGETSGNDTTYTVKNTDKMTLSLSDTGDTCIGVSDANGSTIQNETISTQNPSADIDLCDTKTVSIV
ncbi:helix-turn-helix domain-containing protein, partial [Listeria monocytogenes]|nr:helix-turn-helix domain-containing protein [Listeria monocytogenes]